MTPKPKLSPPVHPAVRLALTKSLTGKALDSARRDLRPGRYSLRWAVQLDGELIVAEDSERAVARPAVALELMADRVDALHADLQRMVDAARKSRRHPAAVLQSLTRALDSLTATVDGSAWADMARAAAATVSTVRGSVTLQGEITSLGGSVRLPNAEDGTAAHVA